MPDEEIPRKDLERLADILNSGDVPEHYLDVLLENAFEFAGATKCEATFVGKDGIRVILMPGRWRCVWPTGKSYEDTSFSLLGEIVDSRLRKM
jgi:hypothetical protein